MPNSFAVQPGNIWNFEQNKPSLVVDDLEGLCPSVDRNRVYEALLRRGVFKWLAVRRDLIKLKDAWKKRLRAANEAHRTAEHYHRAYLKGYRKALVECREEVRALCHSDRWRAPDNDHEAARWLQEYGK